MVDNFQSTIIQNLITNSAYTRAVIPFIKTEYFDNNHRIIFRVIVNYVKKYNKVPTVPTLKLYFFDQTDNPVQCNDEQKELFIRIINSENKHDLEWLLDETEAWCKNQAIRLAVVKSIDILDDTKNVNSRKSIPELLSKALSVSFDSKIGHDYMYDATKRWNFYNTKEERIPFDLELLNQITGGGLPKKTLNIILAATGGGKSLFMTHCAAANLIARKKVLYITMEMAEEKIAERIDSNLTDMSIEDIYKLPLGEYQVKMREVANKTKGAQLFIKEFPTSCAGTDHFRNLIDELKIKKGFIPDIIYLDYLNIAMPSKGVDAKNAGSYFVMKSISEEVRAMAVDYNVPIVSATQTNRQGYNNSDLDLENTSEAYSINSVSDLILALIPSDDLSNDNQIMIKQLKNRYNDPFKFRKFTIGINRSKMKLYNIPSNQQPALF